MDGNQGFSAFGPPVLRLRPEAPAVRAAADAGNARRHLAAGLDRTVGPWVTLRGTVTLEGPAKV